MGGSGACVRARPRVEARVGVRVEARVKVRVRYRELELGPARR